MYAKDFEDRVLQGWSQWVTFFDHDSAKNRVRIGLTEHPEFAKTERFLIFHDVQNLISNWHDRDDECMEIILGAEERLKKSLFNYSIFTSQRELELQTSLRALIFGP